MLADSSREKERVETGHGFRGRVATTEKIKVLKGVGGLRFESWEVR